MSTIGRLIVVQLMLLGMAMPPLADAAERILLVKSAESALYDQVVDTFTRTLQEKCSGLVNCPRIDVVVESDFTGTGRDHYDVIVLIGQQASRTVGRMPNGPRKLHILISEREFDGVRDCCVGTNLIPLEQPLERQLAFIKFLLPEHRRIGVLLSDYTAASKDTLRAIAKRNGFDISFRDIPETNQVGQALHALSNEIDLLLSLPDPLIYNRDTWANILLAAYRGRIPVIGYSESVVRSGALAALHSTPQTIGREAAATAFAILDDKPVVDGPPQSYKVSINRKVARSLHLRLPTDDDIRRAWGTE